MIKRYLEKYVPEDLSFISEALQCVRYMIRFK